MACPKKKISYSSKRKKYYTNNYLFLNQNQQLKKKRFTCYIEDKEIYFKKNKLAEKFFIEISKSNLRH